MTGTIETVEIDGTPLPGVLVVKPAVYRDGRGFFLETWHLGRYAATGIPGKFVQDNVSHSVRGVLRGLHFQYPNPQGKLVYVLDGEIFDVAVDVRAGSPTFAQWFGMTLSGESGRQLWIPEGFAHGFCVLSDTATVAYKCTDFYDPASEHCVRHDDSVIGIEWPLRNPVLSARDRKAPGLDDIRPDCLPPFRA